MLISKSVKVNEIVLKEEIKELMGLKGERHTHRPTFSSPPSTPVRMWTPPIPTPDLSQSTPQLQGHMEHSPWQTELNVDTENKTIKIMFSDFKRIKLKVIR